MAAADVLSVIRMCEALHVLPESGGVLDQDFLFVAMYFKVKELDNVRAELDQAAAGSSQ